MEGSIRVLDVQEKEVGAAKAPSFPAPGASTASGFPQPKKRTRFASAFKQLQQAAASAEAAGKATQATAPASSTTSHDLSEKAAIDRENRERLRNMAPGEIEAARQELVSNLDPALLQILLRRANLDEAGNKDLPGDESAPQQQQAPPPEIRIQDTTAEAEKRPKEQASSAEGKSGEGPQPSSEAKPSRRAHIVDADDVLFIGPEVPPADDLAPIASPEKVIHGVSAKLRGGGHDYEEQGHDHNEHSSSSSTMHFPQAPTVPDLDPDDPDFLQNLHAKYFPNLPADPARLAWMAPLPTADSPADRESPYYPGQDSLAVSQLRFDFRGRLISPRRSREIPVSKGLHHHGVAPEAAGYTVGELARLARSAVPAQRCVAFQILGRILYRLGKGEWGTATSGVGAAVDDPSSDPRVQLAQGVWRSISEGRVLDTLHEAASVEEGGGHRGSRAYALEAIWLYEKGGWKERWMGR